MLTVSTKAKGKLEDLLRKKATDAATAIRITLSTEDPKRLKMLLDKEKPGDQVVQSPSGAKVLLVDSGLSASLEGQALDYLETAQREGFSIHPTASAAG